MTLDAPEPIRCVQVVLLNESWIYQLWFETRADMHTTRRVANEKGSAVADACVAARAA